MSIIRKGYSLTSRQEIVSKKNIEYLIGMERQSGSMDVITPLYVSRMLNVPLEDVEKVMKDMGA